MQTRLLGRTGLKVSALCFGTMSFGGDADEATSAKMFHRCREEGVNTFDCADVYGKGRSEEILGELIAPCRDEVIVASKVYFPTGPDPNAPATVTVAPATALLLSFGDTVELTATVQNASGQAISPARFRSGRSHATSRARPAMTSRSRTRASRSPRSRTNAASTKTRSRSRFTRSKICIACRMHL